MHGHVPPLKLYITESYVQQSNEESLGRTQWSGPGHYTIFAWHGLYDEVPWLYHELEHVLIGDPDHMRREWIMVEQERVAMAERNSQ